MKPKEILTYYSKLFPDAWKQSDTMRSDRGRELPFWPDWCFLPLSGAYSIVWAEAQRQGVISGDKITDTDLIREVGILGALAAWRVTQGVYRFDLDVYKSVIETDISGDLPHDVFFALPEWCVYVETPGLTYFGRELSGFWAHLEYDAGNHEKELRLVLHFRNDTSRVPDLMPFPVHLGPWNLSEAIEKTMTQGTEFSETEGLSPEDREKVTTPIRDNLTAIISLLLYLCSANGEIGDGKTLPVNPRPKKTKRGNRFFPPAAPRQWDVGERMRSAIRAQKQSYSASGESGTGRSSPRSHIRRAHWQKYWTGPEKRPEERKYILKWIPPILVNPSEDQDLPVTIRPVK